MLILSFFAGYSGLFAADEGYKREVTLAWEPVPGSKGYELEVRRFEKGKMGAAIIPVERTVKTSWKGRLPPGKFLLRIRTIDERGVAGPWGDVADFLVAYPAVKMLSPKIASQIKTKEKDASSVKFAWQKVPGVPKYFFEIMDEDGKILQSQLVTENSIEKELKVAKKYTWRVVVAENQEEKGEPPKEPFSFELWGAKLDPSKIEAPDDEFPVAVSWKAAEYAATFNVKVRAKKLGNKGLAATWENISSNDALSENQLKIPDDWSPGYYQMDVTAVGNLRPNSAKASLNFRLGDRKKKLTLAEIIKAGKEGKQVKKESKSGVAEERFVFARGTFHATTVTYNSTDREQGTQTTFLGKGFVGEGRIGTFYPKSMWGLLVSGEFDSFYINDKKRLFFAVDGGLAGRLNLWGDTKLSLAVGAFYKEIPSVSGLFFGGQQAGQVADSGQAETMETNIKAMGPIINGSFQWPLFQISLGLVGVELDTKTYWNVFGLATPNKKKLDYRVSYRMGLMGSLAVTPFFKALLGYHYQADRIAYLSEVGPKSVAASGQVNEIDMRQHHASISLQYWLW